MEKSSDALRRRAGLVFLTTALVLLVLGLTVLQSVLGKGLLFIFYWLGCMAFTGLALLNALLDLLIVRGRARREQRLLLEAHMTVPHVRTQRLKLVLHSPSHLRALIKEPELYASAMGAEPASGLREFITGKEVSVEWLAQLETAAEPDPWTHGFAVIHSADRKVIGMAGYKGPPDSTGMVEISYGIVPEYEGRGFATEAAEALMAYVQRDPRVRLLRAHTLPEANASTRVLTKCGFRKISEEIDPTDGKVWRWEKASDKV